MLDFGLSIAHDIGTIVPDGTLAPPADGSHHVSLDDAPWSSLFLAAESCLMADNVWLLNNQTLSAINQHHVWL
jgi:hypothetical protein